MAWSDLVSEQELETYLRDTLYGFIDWMCLVHPYVVEEFLAEHSQQFEEYIECELGRDRICMT